MRRAHPGLAVFGCSSAPWERTKQVLQSLDISIKMEDGTYVWKAVGDRFELAKSAIQRLAAAPPDEYMIFSQTLGDKMVTSRDRLPELDATL
jgi:hypothetical protein